MEEQKPGQTITPGDSEQRSNASTTEPEPNNQPERTAAEKKPSPASPELQANWTFNPGSAPDLSDTSKDGGGQRSDAGGPVTWSASEFIAHEKSFGWYSLLALVAIVLAGLAYLLTKDKITTGVILFVALVFGFYAGRKPRTLDYKLDGTGIGIGQKFYPYDLFKSFAVIDEGAFSSIVLMPLKRFMPSISIYYTPEDEDKIIKMLSDRLPVEEHKGDAVDNLMRRIRF